MEPSVNFSKEMLRILEKLPRDPQPRLALHACCAPCSSAVIEQLSEYFDITILYYNPNIWPAEEFSKRAEELQRFVKELGLSNVHAVVDYYEPSEFYQAVKGLEDEPERGKRCTVCYHQRMERTAHWAAENGFDWFCTTLSISPHKDAQRINAIGRELEKQYGVRHLTSDFKKRNGFKRSLELSAQYGMYRQDYCGCEFSARRLEENSEN